MLIPLQIAHRSYAQNSKDVVLAPPAGKQLHIYSVEMYNGTGSAIDMGILKRVNLDSVNFYQTVVANTPDATIANGVKTVATKIFTTTINDGFLVQCASRFGMIGLNISTPSTGGVFVVKYYNGSAYVTLTTLEVPTAFSAGTQLIVFAAPHDWVAGTTAGVGGDATKFSILIQATTAPANDVFANSLWVADLMTFRTVSSSTGVLKFSDIPPVKPLILAGGEGIQPYFSGTPSALNTIRVIYSVQE